MHIRNIALRHFVAVLLSAGAVAAVPTLAVAQTVAPISAAALERIPTAAARRGQLVRSVDSIGELKASRSSIVVSPFRGNIVRMVEEGTAVQEGDPIIWLDTEELQRELDDREAQLLLAEKDLQAAEEDYRLQEVRNGYDLMSAEAQVELSQQRLNDTEQKYESERILVEKRISAQSRLEEADLARLQAAVELRNSRINLRKTEENLISNLRVKQNAIDRANLDINRIEREIEEREGRLEQATLLAPVDGEVVYLTVWRSGSSSKLAEGDAVWPRANLAEIPDRSEMLAIIPVNELDIAQVQPGQAASVRLDAIPNEVFTGKVQKKSIVPIEADGDSTNKPREFEVEILLDGTDSRLFQGMTAAANVEIEKVEDAVLVPLEALTIEDDALGVFVRSGASAEFRPARVLLTNDRHCAIEADVADGAAVLLRHPTSNEADARQRGFAALERALREQRDRQRENNQVTPPDGATARAEEAPGA